MVNQDRLVEEFLELVQIDSHSGKEGAIAKILIEKLKELGLDVRRDKAGEKIGGQTGNIIAKLKGSKQGPTIMFSSHMDTVSPGEGVKPLIKDGVIYSDGTTILGADDKAGIASILEAIKIIKENKIEHSDVEIIFSVWEEGGLRGAKNLDLSQVEAKYGFVLDSGGSPGEIIIKGPAQNKINVKVIGKLAHAGVEPEEGISAIMIASRAINNMKLLRIDEETTANIGIISGGQATNIVTAQVNIEAEARSLSEEKLEIQTKHMVETFEKAAQDLGGQVEVQVINMNPALNIDPQHMMVKKLKEVFKTMGLKANPRSTGGGSDANILNGYGIETVNLGIGMKKVHTLEEYIAIEDLVNSSQMVMEIIRSFAK